MDTWGPSSTIVPSFWAGGIMSVPQTQQAEEEPKSRSQLMADMLLTC